MRHTFLMSWEFQLTLDLKKRVNLHENLRFKTPVSNFK